MAVKVAMIGCGSITEFRHAPEYKENGNVEIVAFCDPVQERAERLAGMFGGRAFRNFPDVLAMDGLDAVSVCTSNDTHAEITIAALKAGKHVLCEKPMATSLADAQRMVDAATEYGRILMIGHNQRFVPAHVKAKNILKSGELGRVLTFKTTFGHAGPESWSKDKGAHTWFFRKDSAFLGTMGDLGIHKADLLRWLLDDEFYEVTAFLSTLHKRNHLGELIDVEDNAVCLLKTNRRITGSLSASWTYYGEEDNSTILYCENGILRIHTSPEYPLIVEKRDGERQYFRIGTIQTNQNQTKSGVVDAFVHSVITGEKPAVSGEDGLEALRIVMACKQSAECGMTVKVVRCTERMALNKYA